MRIITLSAPFYDKFSRNSRSPAVSKGGCVYYPIWLGYATGALEQAGHEVKLIDAPSAKQSIEEVEKIVKEFQPKMIVIDTSTASIVNDVRVLNRLKDIHGDCFYVLVGVHASAVPDETLKMSQKIDACTLKEYDLTLVELAKKMENNENISNTLGLALRNKETGEIIFL